MIKQGGGRGHGGEQLFPIWNDDVVKEDEGAVEASPPRPGARRGQAPGGPKGETGQNGGRRPIALGKSVLAARKKIEARNLIFKTDLRAFGGEFEK